MGPRLSNKTAASGNSFYSMSNIESTMQYGTVHTGVFYCYLSLRNKKKGGRVTQMVEVGRKYRFSSSSLKGTLSNHYKGVVTILKPPLSILAQWLMKEPDFF